MKGGGGGLGTGYLVFMSISSGPGCTMGTLTILTASLKLADNFVTTSFLKVAGNAIMDVCAADPGQLE